MLQVEICLINLKSIQVIFKMDIFKKKYINEV